MVLALAIAGAVIWVGLLLAPWRPWSTAERLESAAHSAGPKADLSLITVLVPARDEATLIGRTIGALVGQGEGLAIVVVDDQSTDDTAEFARQAGGDRCTVISGTPVPAGWTGKLWALEQGRTRVRTRLTLLIDADIELRPGILPMLQQRLRAEERQLVSLMAMLEMRSGWEKLLVPAFVFFFKLLYPFRVSNSRRRLVAAAAGGCVLIETAILAQIGGFGALRYELIDDCALARCVKASGGRTWIGLTHGVISHRRMDGLGDIWRMVERSAYAQLRFSPTLLAACVALLAIAFLAPPMTIVVGNGGARVLAAATMLAMWTTYLPTLRFYGRSPLWAPLLPLTGALYMLMTVNSALRHWRGVGSVWKGRRYVGMRAVESGPL